MNVGELISKLMGYPPNTRVVVNGYEQGADDIESVEELDVVRSGTSARYLGRYTDPDDWMADEGQEPEKVVYLSPDRNRDGDG